MELLSILIVAKYKPFSVIPEMSLLIKCEETVTQDMSAVLLPQIKTTE